MLLLLNRKIGFACLAAALATCLVSPTISNEAKQMSQEILMARDADTTNSELMTQVMSSTLAIERFHFHLLMVTNFADGSAQTVSTEGDFVGPNNSHTWSTSSGGVQDESLIRNGEFYDKGADGRWVRSEQLVDFGPDGPPPLFGAAGQGMLLFPGYGTLDLFNYVFSISGQNPSSKASTIQLTGQARVTRNRQSRRIDLWVEPKTKAILKFVVQMEPNLQDSSLYIIGMNHAHQESYGTLDVLQRISSITHTYLLTQIDDASVTMPSP